MMFQHCRRKQAPDTMSSPKFFQNTMTRRYRSDWVLSAQVSDLLTSGLCAREINKLRIGRVLPRSSLMKSVHRLALQMMIILGQATLGSRITRLVQDFGDRSLQKVKYPLARFRTQLVSIPKPDTLQQRVSLYCKFMLAGLCLCPGI